MLDVKGGLIVSCQLCGDFFALREVAELEALLVGRRADAPSLRAALDGIPVESWFMGAEREALLDFLCGEVRTAE